MPHFYRLLRCFLMVFPAALGAQLGGISAYEFLNLPNSATVAAMGGHHIALRNEDLSLAARNPSLLNPAMDGRVSLSHAFHPAGISNSYLGYGYEKAEWKTTFQAGLQYVNYGDDLIRRDVTGQDLGSFNLWRKYNPTGQMIEEVTFADNLENGPFREWFDNGQLAAEGSYLDGDNEDGRLRVYNEDGSLNRVMDCDMGACTSLWRDSDGIPLPDSLR